MENKGTKKLEKILVSTLIGATIIDGFSKIITGQSVGEYITPEMLQGFYDGVTKFGPAWVLAGIKLADHFLYRKK